MRRAVLMCAGEYEPIPIPVGRDNKSLRSAEAFADEPFVVSVDGGLPRLLDADIVPDLVLGDFDSLDKKYHPYLEEFGSRHPDRLLRLPCEKDDTDTVYAARVCLERGCRELLFYGALGGRLDHTMANVQTLLWIKRHGGHAWLAADGNRATVIEAEELEIPAGFEGTVSVFALDRTLRGVGISGLLYSVQDAEITNGYPIGCSNEKLAGAPGRIRIAEGAALVVMIDKLLAAGCHIRAYDPIAMNECRRRIGDRVTYCRDMYDAVLDADALLLLTEWKEFRLPTWGVIRKAMKNPLVIDGRNIFDIEELEENEFEYHCIGK